jgi:glycosyltransferase involved in cell wall biosynthesis
MSVPQVEVLLPVHNEVESIEAVIHEIYDVVSPIAPMRFLVCEDGSTDGTPRVLERLAGRLPIRLFSGGERKGYSRAVTDGFRRLEAPWLLFLDSDGQVDPRAFVRAWPLREQCHIVIGWRKNRADSLHRRIISKAFRSVYRMLFRVPLHDPSCPFLLIRREVVQALVDQLGVLKQGFWWEFIARAHHAGFRVMEIPITHRRRAKGQTQVYSWRRIPGIAWSHLRGLFIIRRQLLTARNRIRTT